MEDINFDNLLELLLEKENDFKIMVNADQNILETKWRGSETLLHYCSTEGHLDAVKFLFNLGANPNSRNRSGDTPLFSAILSNDFEMVELLLSLGADPLLGSPEFLNCYEWAEYMSRDKKIISLMRSKCFID